MYTVVHAIIGYFFLLLTVRVLTSLNCSCAEPPSRRADDAR
jgi:hypothetical protein